MDWLLVGIFLFMSLTIISRADLKTDGLIVFVGVFGGLAIGSWGTLLAALRLFLRLDVALRCPNLGQVLYLPLPCVVRIAHPDAHRPSAGCSDLPGG